jgi:hypothetical protein
MSGQPNDHPGSPLLHWLRLNVGIAMALLSMVSVSVGALVGGTLRLDRYDFRLTTLEGSQSAESGRVATLQVRIDAGDERRITEANEFGLVNQRLGVLESQMKFLGDWAHDNSFLTPRPPGRRQ